MKKLSYNITALSLLILSFTCEAAFPIITLNGNADTTINGCSETKEAFIPICILTETPIWIPNAFSPNGDDYNNTFRPMGDFIRSYELTIYDRWGAKIFKSSNSEKAWDGKHQPPGVYVYQVTLILKNNKRKYRSGTVTLLR